LDPTAAREASFQVLEGLAAGTDAEVLGLFIEDVNLLNMATLSIAREITFEGAPARRPERQTIEQQFRTHAARMRTLFQKAVRAIDVRHSFRVTRGELRAELLKTAEEFDTLVLTHSRHELGARLSTQAQLGGLLAHGPRTLVVVQEQWRTGRTVAAVFDGSPESVIALQTAGLLSESEFIDLSIWLPADTDGELQARAEEVLSDRATVHFRSVATDDIEAIVRASDAEGVRALILPAGDPEFTNRMVPALLDRLSCSMIVVR
jgi:hypothetical protein